MSRLVLIWVAAYTRGDRMKLMRTPTAFLCWLLLAFQTIAAPIDHASRIASLIDPAKLATLKQRGANPRIQKCVYWLAVARSEGSEPGKILDLAIARAGYTNQLAAQLTKEALLRNLDIADKLGCLNAGGLVSRDEARQRRHGDERAIRGRSAIGGSHHPQGGCAGTRPRDRQSGIDADASEHEKAGQDRRPATGYGR